MSTDLLIERSGLESLNSLMSGLKYYGDFELFRGMRKVYIKNYAYNVKDKRKISIDRSFFRESRLEDMSNIFGGVEIENLPIGLFSNSGIRPKGWIFQGATIRGYKPTPEELFGRPVDISFEELYAGAELLD